jgi:aryl-phospho-beta-D-glucosidase BglC (GH1 family)
MMRLWKLAVLATTVLIVLAGCGDSRSLTFDPDTPVGRYGKLQLVGTQLSDSKGNPVQLKGMSFMDVSWFGEYANTDCMKWLRDDWGCTVIRAALYTEDAGHVVSEKNWDKVDKAVQAATEAGLYVIIDWHILGDGNPQKNKAAARDFFARMAKTYKNYPNVMYEICNEPNGDDVRWKTEIKPYAEEIIPIIRRHDKDGIILVGTSTWSSDIDQAAKDPLKGKNIMYVAHFYAGSHGDNYQRKIKDALSLGAPAFVTEWGTTRADTTGGVFYYPTLYWVDFLDEYKLSWCNWSISTRDEYTSALRTTALPRGNWSPYDLTESGLFVRSLIRGDKELILFSEGFETENFTSGGWERDKTRISRENVYEGSICGSFGSENSLLKEKPTANLGNLTISFVYRSATMNGSDLLSVEWFDGSVWSTLTNLQPAAEWTPVTLPFPDGANGNYGFKFRLKTGILPEGNTVFVDNILLEGMITE